MKANILFLISLFVAVQVCAAEHSYIWGEVFPNYSSQIPSSDFTTPDGLFRFTSDKAGGVSGPTFGVDSKAGLLYRLYADNTLRIESLKGAKISAITFVIGGNGHYKLSDLTPSSGAMGTPYLGKDETGSFREYRLFWEGNTTDVTFTVGHECVYGIDCLEQEKSGEPGTCMTKQMIITAEGETPSAINAVPSNPAPLTAKHLINGQLYIIRDGKIYNAQGALVNNPEK